MVSIVIPVYNGANYMRAAIDSALAQTYPHIEVLVVNDGSKDDDETERIARSYGERIRYFAKENGGVASALNRGIQEMKGDYFAWLSHDDLFLPEKIARQVEFLQNHKAFAACDTDYFQIDGQGKIIRKISTPCLPKQKAIKALFGRQYINGSTMMIKRECFDRAGLFDEKLRYTQDTEMWFRLLQHYEFGHVPFPFGGQRIHAERGSGQILNLQKESQKLLETLFVDLAGQGLLDGKSQPAGEAEKLARRHIWFGRAVSRGRGWYQMGDEHLRRALTIWRSIRNPGRFHLLLNKMIPIHHRLQRSRVKVVHWLMKKMRKISGIR